MKGFIRFFAGFLIVLAGFSLMETNVLVSLMVEIVGLFSMFSGVKAINK